MPWQPDYRHFEDVMRNRRPSRLPLYEHLVNPGSMDQITGRPFASLANGDQEDRQEYMRRYCDFFREMTYDTVSIEYCVGGILPGSGALLGEHPGPIQSRADFDAYPWADLPRIYAERAYPMFDLLRTAMPTGMKAVGGVGNGVFEISEELVGFEWLCYLQADDPDLFADLFRRIGDLLLAIWTDFLPRYGDLFAACRIGDDLGYKTGTLLSPQTVLQHIIPQYRRIIAAIHGAGKLYLQHSCGCIFDVMDAWIDAGIDAKHSNEDAIAPFEDWITLYGDRIALVGGIDTDRLCRMAPDEIVSFTVQQGTRCRRQAKGFALGSGNSIPEYVPPAGYLAMIEGARRIREAEA